MMNSIADFSTILFARHVSLAEWSPDLGSCGDLNCALGCPFLPHPKRELFPPTAAIYPVTCKHAALVFIETRSHYTLLSQKATAMEAAVPSVFSMSQQQPPS